MTRILMGLVDAVISACYTFVIMWIALSKEANAVYDVLYDTIIWFTVASQLFLGTLFLVVGFLTMLKYKDLYGICSREVVLILIISVCNIISNSLRAGIFGYQEANHKYLENTIFTLFAYLLPDLIQDFSILYPEM